MNQIPVAIPYRINNELGQAYNYLMESIEDWVIFIDHDILLGLNPFWHQICLDAIEKVGHKAGWITCRVNTGRKEQKINESSKEIEGHYNLAKKRYKQYKGQLTDVTDTCGKFAGNFILTHKKAWKDAEGFKEGFMGVDFNYYYRLRKAGYRFYEMEDLYVYHLYKREHKTNDFGSMNV